MKLNSLTKYKKPKKRLGRGRATGVGKTSGRGHGGQKSRSGKTIRPGFEGGQTPLFIRLPKYRGFKNPNYVDYAVINVSQLEELGEKTVTPEVLIKHGLMRKTDLVKVLGNGEITKAVSVTAHKASKSAIDKISKAGGSFTALLVKEDAPQKADKKAPEAKAEEKAEKEAPQKEEE